MQRFYLTILLLVLSPFAGAQNLVMNGSFDQVLGCPTALSMLDSTASWQNPTINGTPDFFHVCSSPFFAGVPMNALGYQQPHSGESYAGIHRWLPSAINYREYMEGNFTSPLIAGQCYYFEMYISLSNFSEYTSSAIGVLFSDTLITGIVNSQMLAFTPQIMNPSNMIPDTAGWMLVSGMYTATGGENHLIIGNFTTDAVMDTILVNPSAPWAMSYVYVDDVSLTPCTGIQGYGQLDNVQVFPNPVHDIMNVKAAGYQQAQITVYDISLSEVITTNFINETTLDLRHLEPGVYIYRVISEKGESRGGKLIKY
jgi:hypothetical protein